MYRAKHNLRGMDLNGATEEEGLVEAIQLEVPETIKKRIKVRNLRKTYGETKLKGRQEKIIRLQEADKLKEITGLPVDIRNLQSAKRLPSCSTKISKEQ